MRVFFVFFYFGKSIVQVDGSLVVLIVHVHVDGHADEIELVGGLEIVERHQEQIFVQRCRVGQFLPQVVFYIYFR